MFLDLSAAPGMDLEIDSLTTASTAGADVTFGIEVFTRSGSALGGPVGSGPGSSSDGWTSLGSVVATQGGTASGVSLSVDVPNIFVPAGGTTGVALLFSGAGPRYVGTGSPALSTFTDGTLTLVTGNARSVPFTTTGTFFSSRAMVGSVTYVEAVPEPATLLAMTIGAAGLLRRRNKVRA